MRRLPIPARGYHTSERQQNSCVPLSAFQGDPRFPGVPSRICFKRSFCQASVIRTSNKWSVRIASFVRVGDSARGIDLCHANRVEQSNSIGRNVLDREMAKGWWNEVHWQGFRDLPLDKSSTDQARAPVDSMFLEFRLLLFWGKTAPLPRFVDADLTCSYSLLDR